MANPVSCSTCGQSNPAGARFCNACGSALAVAGANRSPPARSYTPKHLLETVLNQRAALEGERKRVTVLFADLKGSTALAAQVGDEEWHGILDRFFAILTAGIHRYEGNINQYTGDGVMALFGAPLAQEDHALRACRAALGLQTELRAYADELRLTRGLSLSARMGLNSGEVVVGKIGDDLRMDYTAQGHTVNLAARMEQIAEPGRIYLTSYTANQVKGYVNLRDLGALPVKGQEAPVHVFELESLGAMATRLDRSRSRGLSSFVGRQRELGLLNEALASARDGAGQVVAVIGNAGIGKSRLSYEFTEHCRAQRIPIYASTCVPYHSAVPLYPVLGLMKSYFGIEEQDSPLEQRRKVAGGLMLADATSQEYLPLLFEVLGVNEPGDAPAPVPPELRQTRLFELLRKIMLPARTAPVVLLVEDLHWLDQASEQFLVELAKEAHEGRTLLLLNYRPDYVANWLTQGLDLELALGALGRAELSDLLVQRLGSSAEMRSLAARLAERAAGNPFFAEEAVQSLIEQEVLTGTPGNYRAQASLEVLPLPDSVQGILAARMDRLPHAEKAVLQVAAVLGRDFTLARLAPVVERITRGSGDPVALDPALEALVETGFVHPEGEEEGSFSFCHPLMMEVAYRSQLKDRRRAVHRALAETLEADVAVNPRRDERIIQLAHHWDCADDTLKAAIWNLRAGLWSGTNGDARTNTHYQRAIELLATLPRSKEVDTLAVQARAGVVRTATSVRIPPEVVERAFEEGVALAEAGGLPAALAELRVSHAAYELNQGHADQAYQQVKAAIVLARQANDEGMIGRFRIPILLSFMASGHLREGLDVLTPPGQAPWYEGPITADNFLSRGMRGFMLAYMGELRAGRADMETALAIEMEERRSVSWLHALLVDLAWLSGAHSAAMRDAQAAVARAERFGSDFFLTLAYCRLAIAHSLNHNHAEAVRLLEQWLPHTRHGGAAHQFESVYLAALADALMGSGARERALAVAREAVASAERSQTRLWGCLARLHLATALRQSGELEAAAAELDRLEQWVAETGAISFQAFLSCERGELKALAGAESEARALFVRALQEFRQLGADGRAERMDARLATLGVRAA